MTDPEIVQGKNEQGREVRFETVYTDISCFDMENSVVRDNVKELLLQIKNPDSRYGHLQDKLIFGVDWYLSLIVKTPKYKEFVESFYTAMKGIDENQWIRSSLVNPAVFYGLDNPGLVSKMHTALTKACKYENDKIKISVENNYKKIQTIGKQISQFQAGSNKKTK